MKDERPKTRRGDAETFYSPFLLYPSSFILHPSSLILHPSSFILEPSAFCLLLLDAG